MNVYLYYCPGADPAMPHAALPALGAQLREDGLCEYVLRDLNLEVFLYFLTEEKLTAAAERVALRVEEGGLDSERLKKAEKLLKDTTLPRRIEGILGDYRDPEAFYNPERFLKAKAGLKAACGLISLQYDGIRFDKYSVFKGFRYDSYEQIREALDHPAAAMLREFYRDKVIPGIEANQPEIVGLSVTYFPQVLPCFLLADEIRKVSGETHITLGGPVVTWGKTTMTRQAGKFSSLIDSFCVAEGETCISGLVEAIKNNGRQGDLSAIRNLVYFKDGEACATTHEAGDLSLDKLFTPDYEHLELKRYLAPDRVLSMPLTKGCYYNKCTFCNYAFIKMTHYRERPAVMAAEDIRRIVAATGERVFSFESDVISPAYVHQFCRALLEMGVEIKWHGVMRFEENLDQAFFDTLAAAGCVRMYFGLESANPRILKEMDKGIRVEAIEEILSCCARAGIATEAGVLLAYPGEKVEEAEDTLNFIKRNRLAIDRADVGFFRLLKGAPVVELLGDWLLPGKKPEDYWYAVEGKNPVLEKDREKFDAILNEIKDLYPILKAADISEEILYLAKYGKEGVRMLERAFNA